MKNDHIGILVRTEEELRVAERFFKKRDTPKAYEIIGVYSENNELIGKTILNDHVVSANSIFDNTLDDLLVMVKNQENEEIVKLKHEISEKYDFPTERIASYTEIIQIPSCANVGSIIIDKCVPRETWVDFNSLVVKRLIKGTNDLEEYFLNASHDTLHKWLHYYEIYDRYFSRFRGTNVKVLEIGVFRGGSLQMWKSYFGGKSEIVGVDIDPQCKKYEADGISIEIGSQEDEQFLCQLGEKYGSFDIIIDDGGHTMKQQKRSLNTLLPFVVDGGIYLCEDCHTSYWKFVFNGGYRKRRTFIEYSKRMVDVINQAHIPKKWFDKRNVFLPMRPYRETKFDNTIKCVTFFDSIVIFEKNSTGTPFDIMRNIVK